MTEITQPTYIVYQISFHSSKMVYIGYTSKGSDGRLQEHIKNMRRGMDSYLYRAMRKYGVENLRIEVIEVCENKTHAQEREKYHIKEKGSFVEGYNMTSGGDGGNVFEGMSEEKKTEWLKQRRFLSSGFNNGNCSGATDEEIVFHACKVAKRDGYLTRGNYREYAKKTKEKFNLPLNIASPKFRFNKLGFNGLKILVAEALSIDVEELKYTETKKHRESISRSMKKFNWVNNGKETRRVKDEDFEEYINNGWVRGRIL